MKAYRFEPGLMARREVDPNHDPYRAFAEMLRDYLGGDDVFAQARKRARRDPRLRAMIQDVSEMLTRPAERSGIARLLPLAGRHGTRA